MKIQVGDIEFGGEKLCVIAGPCVIESREHCLKMAESLKNLLEKLEVPFVFKTSFDKANRTSVDSFRGPGLDDGLAILQDVKEQLDVIVLTDIHEPRQASPVAEVVDIVQIPAFLCRQTSLLLAAGKTGSAINVKKGQFIAPWDVKPITKKIESTGNHQIIITDRGVSFGYNTLISDMRSIPIIQKIGYPVVFDATHSAQRPGEMGSKTGGDREMIPVLARAAVAAGCDAIFLEVHDNVAHAKSDAATQWPLDQTEKLIRSLINIREIAFRYE